MCVDSRSLGPARSVRPRKVYTTMYIDPPDIPFATVEFRYRSLGMWLMTLQTQTAHTCLEALKVEGVMPRSPSPMPLEERPIDSLSQQEMRELLIRQRVSI